MRVADLKSFMEARHAIYIRRASGAPFPWTSDAILQKYRFCNVYRELDVVTRWVADNIRTPYAEHENLWFMLAIARQINWPETLQDLMNAGCWPTENSWNWKLARQVMLDRQARGEQLYTGAYMLNAHGTAPSDPKDKAFFTTRLVLDSVWQAKREIVGALGVGTLESAWRAFLPYHGWGPFTAYEVVTDLRWTRYLHKAPDINTWANAGPGAIRGLNRVYGRPLTSKLGAQSALAEMRQLLTEVSRIWPIGQEWPRLELREIEHSLCEFDKYERVRLGEGRPRSTFRPNKDVLP